MKICTVCNLEKDNVYFPKTGLVCKKCKSLRARLYYLENKETILSKAKNYRENNKKNEKERHKEYYINNIDKIKQDRLANKEASIIYRENYYLINRDKFIKDSKEYYQNNKEAVLQYKKEFYILNKEDKKIYNKKYAVEHEKERKQYVQQYTKNKRKNNPFFRIRTIISTAIGRQLKSNNSSKNNNSIMKYLDYSIDDLIIHLQNKFESWMNWDNHGLYNRKTWNDDDQTTWKWQIDHIIPHSTFYYISMADQAFKDCWALSNLRPYSAKQNVIDGNRR